MKSRVPSFIIGFIVPLFLMVGCMPLYNRIEPVILGFPFLYFWVFTGLFVTALCLAIAYKIDPKNKDTNTED